MSGVALSGPTIVVLVGPSASGKSTWAEAHFAPHEIVSSDRLRALVGEGEHDLAASTPAFEILDAVVERRSARRLTTVIDSLGYDDARRAHWIALARRHHLPVVAVVFDTAPAVCRERNRTRARAVPAKVLDAQLRTLRALRPRLATEGFDAVHGPVSVEQIPARFVATNPLVRVQKEAPAALRFGLQLPSYTWSGGPAEIGPRLARFAARAEEVGFESIWLMDHFRQIPFVGPEWLDMLESYTALGFLAGSTSRARLGTMVTGVTYRNLAHLGKIVATLDVLSGGRAVCGIGAAWFESEHRGYGYRFPSLAERYALLEDALQLLPLLWGPGRPSFEGRTIRASDLVCYPRPLQSRIPILVGGGGERRTLRLVARYADACNIIGEADVVARKVAVLHRHCEELGRDPATIEVTQLSQALVATDRNALARAIEARRPGRWTAERYANSVNAGTVDDHIGRYRALVDAGTQTAIVSLPDLDDPEPIERFAAVIGAFR